MSAILMPQLLRCIACEHEWRERLIYNVAISVWAAHVKNLHCPSCGANWRRLAFKAEASPEVGAA